VDASVTLTNVATQQVRAARATKPVFYSAPAILPGIYNVRVQKAGFKVSRRTAVEVQVGDVIRADFSLQLGEISQSVEITGAAEQLNTQSSAMGSVVAGQQIAICPSMGGLSEPGYTEHECERPKAVPASAAYRGACRASTNISIAGQRLDV